MPELSFGSHFFLDLVETNIFYAALFMDNANVVFDLNWLNGLSNELPELIPDATEYDGAIRVHGFKNEIKLLSDLTSQQVVCLK